MARHKDTDWNLPSNISWEHVQVALLMDIRDELKNITRRINCHETLAIPQSLKKIVTNTNRIPRKKRKYAKK